MCRVIHLIVVGTIADDAQYNNDGVCYQFQMQKIDKLCGVYTNAPNLIV